MTGLNDALPFFFGLGNLSPLSIHPFALSLGVIGLTPGQPGVKQQPPLHTKVLLALSSQDSLLVFRKTGRVAMKSKKLVDLVVVFHRSS